MEVRVERLRRRSKRFSQQRDEQEKAKSKTARTKTAGRKKLRNENGRPTPRVRPVQIERRRPRQIVRALSSGNLLLSRERQSPIGVSSRNESRTPFTGRRCVFSRRAIRQYGLAHLDSRIHAAKRPLRRAC